jgi:large subunit ribosomal protein L9
MRVILTQTVENLGIVGEEKEVKDGFARNYLIPQKKAVVVGDPSAKSIIQKVKEEREKVAEEVKNLKMSAEKLQEKVVEIKAKAGENGKLFGSVTSDDIADELKIDKKLLTMDPIKEVGEHNVVINLGHEVKTKIKIIVTPISTKKSKTEK